MTRLARFLISISPFSFCLGLSVLSLALSLFCLCTHSKFLFLSFSVPLLTPHNMPLERCDSARAGGGALPVIMSIIWSSAKPTTTTATTTSECAVKCCSLFLLKMTLETSPYDTWADPPTIKCMMGYPVEGWRHRTATTEWLVKLVVLPFYYLFFFSIAMNTGLNFVFELQMHSTR